MKKVLFFLPAFLLVVALTVSCNNGTDGKTSSKDSTGTSATADSMNYPYTIKNPDGWEPGDRKHTLNALKSIKAYENNNIDECVSYFADSVSLRFDEMDQKVSNDSLKVMFKRWRAGSKSIKVDMHDWESVKNKFTGEEYVSMWYNQTTEDASGHIDSMSVMDDLKIKNGKIAELDEKTRKYPKKKS